MSQFVAALPDLFEQFGPITVRKMFGGFGLYHDGLMFAIVVDDTLYLKTDSETASDFVTAGLEQFSYERAGKTVKLSFYRAPDEIVDDREQAASWAHRALQAAGRARAAKNPAARR
jgi:DNA transformation protein